MLKRIFTDEKGQSMVIFPILLVVLIGFAGLAIDGGRLYIAKSQLQKAVDAGVLAGADAIIDDYRTRGTVNYTIGTSKATTIAENNYNDENDSITNNITYSPVAEHDDDQNLDYVQVTGKEKVSLLLMPVLGMSKLTEVHATARVNIGKTFTADGGVIPIGLPVKDFKEKQDKNETDYQLLYEPGGGKKGNYSYLDFSSIMPAGKLYGHICEVNGIDDFDCPSPVKTSNKVDSDTNEKSNGGTKSVGDFIENGFPDKVSVGQEVDTKTGISTKSENILPAIKDKIGKVVYIPIISETGPGKSTVVILGFAAFQINSLSSDEKTINATFLEVKVPGDIGNVPVDLPIFSQLVL
ncbi:TadE/TadG family type IV pilus assembly protein [Neobacillus dielmonensis]|uniref:TadE/TadG family type IV pilus assembly protein n=1 Tax=Neobacillus dielmonensis TaxID=1347369 RepID=UPI0005A5FE8D|nr:Tad domain-containing protein [Neobacillus dielmonensis]